MKSSVRIEKYLSDQGIASRREAKVLISKGLVKVNGTVVYDPIQVFPHDVVVVSVKSKKVLNDKKTVAVYKPRGIISSKDTDSVKNVFSLFSEYADLNTVGRLDKESEGLLLLSNDGLVTKAITGKEHLIEKEYLVTVREDITPAMMKRMNTGIKLDDGWTLPAHAEKIDTHTFRIILKEGRKHQIRRMSNACRLTIDSLKRIRIGSITLKELTPGHARLLTEQEVASLKKISSEKNTQS